MGIDDDLWRDYLLATEFGIPPHAAVDMSAVRLDWLLAVHAAVAKKRKPDG